MCKMSRVVLLCLSMAVVPYLGAMGWLEEINPDLAIRGEPYMDVRLNGDDKLVCDEIMENFVDQESMLGELIRVRRLQALLLSFIVLPAGDAPVYFATEHLRQLFEINGNASLGEVNDLIRELVYAYWSQLKHRRALLERLYANFFVADDVVGNQDAFRQLLRVCKMRMESDEAGNRRVTDDLRSIFTFDKVSALYERFKEVYGEEAYNNRYPESNNIAVELENYV